MKGGRIAGRMSILRIPSAAGRASRRGALPIAFLWHRTVNVYPACTPTAWQKPCGLASVAHSGPGDSP